MPFNLFKKPIPSNLPLASTLDSPIFPSPEQTYALTASILLHLHPDALASITASDTEKFLTSLYGTTHSLHWTWIGITFPPGEVLRALKHASDPTIPRAQRNALHAFVLKQQREESERKSRYFEQQGLDAGNAYVEGERKRMEGELQDLREMMLRRRERLPYVARYIWTEAGGEVYFERKGDKEAEKKKGRKRYPAN
ncbi:MAG: hypothetical protein L6R40_003528 [Gallowayella cf. fulva]|nr:MAG: hypothetical protein L6R40_003528 [Xanthomendoza cf. fulva]